jgi:hypothetical protein
VVVIVIAAMMFAVTVFVCRRNSAKHERRQQAHAQPLS